MFTYMINVIVMIAACKSEPASLQKNLEATYLLHRYPGTP